MADVFRHFGPAFRDRNGASLSAARRRAMIAIESCRTAALGGHLEECGDCGHQRVSYNSCRHKACPKCQGLARARWLEDRQAELLDVPYFHVVFTVPSEIEVIAFQNQAVAYDILFQAASETLRKIAADPKHLGAEIGFLGVLHTWGQSLQHHPHIHFLVPGGGIAPDGDSWIACRPGFFLPVTVLSSMFRGLFLRYLTKAFAAGALKFFSAHRHLNEPAAFRRYLARFGTPTGSSTRSLPSPDRRRFSTMSGGILIVSPSPTAGCCRWTPPRSGSDTRITGTATARRR